MEVYYAHEKLLRRIQPLLSDSKKKGPEDLARDELKVLFAKAEGLIKQVYVRHPCYDDIAQALLDGGMHDLMVRVPLTVGGLLLNVPLFLRDVRSLSRYPPASYTRISYSLAG